MYRQKGSSVLLNDNGQAQAGIIIRHLVLPDGSQDSKNILTWIAENLSASVNISLMSQYGSTQLVSGHPVLSRPLKTSEYDGVVKHLEMLGFENGWVQEMASREHYKPDFNFEHPFEQ
jgi:putative pyruvate formate lyase activating enzyme